MIDAANGAIKREGHEMPETEDIESDLALEALESLTEVAANSANELNVLNDELTAMQRRRRRGWSWQQIIASDGIGTPLSAITRIAANLGRASSRYRRALTRALHKEGMQITDIATLFGVSRQRISALFRPSPDKAPDQ